MTTNRVKVFSSKLRTPKIISKSPEAKKPGKITYRLQNEAAPPTP